MDLANQDLILQNRSIQYEPVYSPPKSDPPLLQQKKKGKKSSRSRSISAAKDGHIKVNETKKDQ